MRIAILPGTFDPPTLGHVDVIERAASLVDRLIVLVATNPLKKPHLAQAQRVRLLRASLPQTVQVDQTSGLLVDYCARVGATCIVKGVRDGQDLAEELTQAGMNRHLGGVETILLPASPRFAHVSSSVVRQLAYFGRDVSDFVPPAVARALADNE